MWTKQTTINELKWMGYIQPFRKIPKFQKVASDEPEKLTSKTFGARKQV
jgi:hypothetical protein